MRLRFSVSATLALGTLCACGGKGGTDTVTAPFPSQVVITGGNNQGAFIQHSLPQPLAIRVTNSDGSRAVNVPVHWAVTSGGGTLSEYSVRTDLQGGASVVWTLGSTLGAQSVTASVAGFDGPPTDFAATGRPLPMVLQYTGSTWNLTLLDTTNVGAVLTSIWGPAGSGVVAVGTCRNMPITMVYNGGGWSAPPAGCTQTLPGDNFAERYTSVWGNSASDVFAVRQKAVGMFASVAIDHYDGQSWARVYSRQCSPCALIARAVWTGAPGSAIAVGDSGTVMRYNGISWSPEASGTTVPLRSVWGAGPSGPVFAVGDGGTVLVNNGSGWSSQPSGTSQPLYSVWGTSGTDVFAVGGGGTIIHYDGTAWTSQASGSTQSLRGLWGTSSNLLFAVGDATTVLRYDGSNWTLQPLNSIAGGSMNLTGVWGTSATNVIAVGQSL
jgi:hypothetical protein